MFGSELHQIGIFAQVGDVAPCYCESSLFSFQHILLTFKNLISEITAYECFDF